MGFQAGQMDATGEGIDESDALGQREAEAIAMPLVCCLDPAEGCKCERNKVCGGVHIIDVACEVHATVQYRCTIHEVGAKRIEVVE